MNVPACRTPLALSFVFVLVCLGLPVLLLRGGSSVNAQIEKGAFTVKNFSLSPPGEREEPQPNQTVRNSTASPTQPTTDLIIDDGTFEAAVGISGGGTAIGVNRLTPASYPATLTAVLVFFQGQQGAPPASPITILAGTNPSGGANINNITFTQVSAAVEASDSFWVYPVTPVTINSGDFVVGFRIMHAAGVLPLAIDRSSAPQRRSYLSTDGTTFTILDDLVPSAAGNLMIRARVQGQAPGCPAASGVNPSSGGPGSQVTITGNNFTGVNAVRFANNVNASFTVNSATQITATVPQGAVSGPITISKPNCPDTTTSTFTVPGGCSYSINPASQSFTASAGTGSVAVTTQTGCAWTAVSNASFITVTSGASGAGAGAVNYSVAANSGAARSGTITIAGQTFTVNQSGGSCTYSISPTFRSAAIGGGSDTVAVTTQAGCAWTAVSNVNWITITSGAGGNGSGTVGYSVASNAGNPPRSGTVTIAGRTFTVDQAGCAYTLSASSQTFSSGGGNGSVNVTTASGCNWTAASNAQWITINSGASGSGAGAVNYTVAANTGAPRIGTMTIAGRTFTVAQGSTQPTPYRGAWQGTTNQNLPLQFTVDNNDIVVNLEADVRISFFVPPSGTLTCTYRLRGDAPAIINNGQFAVTLVSANSSVAFQTSAQPMLRGTLSSATSASGQITGSTAGVIICGSTLTIGSISVSSKTWNATKQVQPGCPNATGINPASGQTGAQVTITGSGFTGVNAVKFANNAPASFNIVSDTQITTTVPAGAGTGPIVISKPNCPDAVTANFTNASAVGPLASVSAASFLGSEISPESIVAAFGQNLAASVQVAQGQPLPFTLGETSVMVRDSAGFAGGAAGAERSAPLFFVSPGQVNLQIPQGTASGDATITVLRNGSPVASGTARVASVAPGLFTANASGQGVAAAVAFRLRADGSQSFEPVAQFDSAQGRFVPVPIDLGPATDQVFLILYGTGFRFVSSLAAATATIGGDSAEVLFAGPAPGLVGADQANLRLSRNLIGRGDVDVVLTVDGKTANTVRINVK